MRDERRELIWIKSAGLLGGKTVETYDCWHGIASIAGRAALLLVPRAAFASRDESKHFLEYARRSLAEAASMRNLVATALPAAPRPARETDDPLSAFAQLAVTSPLSFQRPARPLT